MQLLDRPALNLTVREQANLLTLSRRSVYYQPTAPTTAEVTIKHAIDTIYTDQPSYGSRRIAVILERDHQLVVNRKAVQRHMREMGIAGISPGPNLSRRNPEHQVYPYLLRNLVAARPNHVWAIDRYRWRIQTPRVLSCQPAQKRQTVMCASGRAAAHAARQPPAPD